MTSPHTPQLDSEELRETIDDVFDKLNGSGAHACYCPRSTDNGCTCAIKDEYLVEAKQTILAAFADRVLAVLPEKIEPLVPGQHTISDTHNAVVDQFTTAITNLVEKEKHNG